MSYQIRFDPDQAQYVHLLSGQQPDGRVLEHNFSSTVESVVKEMAGEQGKGYPILRIEYVDASGGIRSAMLLGWSIEHGWVEPSQGGGYQKVTEANLETMIRDSLRLRGVTISRS